ncbi:receptor-type tyrosine-protein phosphatase T-like [Littorina saxatilis]|uniref:receptor-type tyrosine-protein phosphatase T-like n=1 Tax=Littorina saxatilis TaxID=31220 RepID=UPI0038B42200
MKQTSGIMNRAILVHALLLLAVCVLPVSSQCNAACDACTAPGADRCINCSTGYSLVDGVCTACTPGQFGVNCNATCHCLDNNACNHVTGLCTGKCQKGYYKPPECQDVCPDQFYGLDCLEECHCLNNSVCDKVLGFCPGNKCHPDWTKFACSKRKPKLALPPNVTKALCNVITLAWPAWSAERDFGDISLPVYDYRVYTKLNRSDVWPTFPTCYNTHQPTTQIYSCNIPGLQRDEFYDFRVDVHYSDNGKPQGNDASPGFVTDPPIWVPCTTTTSLPRVTIPIIVGSEVFDTMSASNQPDGSLLVTWSLDPDIRRFSWDIILSYQRVGIGDCAPLLDIGEVIVPINQSLSSYSLTNLASWSRYNIRLNAQGLGAIASASGSENIIATSSEVPPIGKIINVRVSNFNSKNATIAWDPLLCPERGGLLLRYEVLLRPLDNNRASSLSQSSNVTSLLVTGLTPFTTYETKVRYVNSKGAGPYSDGVNFTTIEDIPAAVSISRLDPTMTTMTVNFQAPTQANGIITEYYIQYSENSTFIMPTSLTFNDLHPNGSVASTPVLRRLNPNTRYYVKVRARTVAGYGPYGNTQNARTAQLSPYPPSSLLQSYRNSTCIEVTWAPPDQTAINVTGYTIEIISQSGSLVERVGLSATATSYSRCILVPGTVYNVSVTSVNGSRTGEPITIQVSTEHAVPPSPPAVQLVNVTSTSAAVILRSVTLTQGPLSFYQLEVERLPQDGSTTRRKRLAEVPGYVTAQFSPGEVGSGLVFIIGDGGSYGGYDNMPLEPIQRYRVHYVVVSTLQGITKFSYSTLNPPFTTLPPVTTSTIPPTEETTVEVIEPDKWAPFIGVIAALVFVILLIIFLIIFIICWKRRQNAQRKAPPQPLDDFDEVKVPMYDPERYWNQTTELNEGRFIVAGRDCVPDEQLIPVNPKVPQPRASKVRFEKEFHSLPHIFEQATTLEAEQHQDRNRFPHILAYDHSRVELSIDSASRCHYINANFMSGYRSERCYIAAQSPYNDVTAVDFWRLIYQQKVKTVVMIANIVEDNIVKCTQFWPEKGKVSISNFYLELQEKMEYTNVTMYDVSVRAEDEQYGRVVRLFEFTSWPEHGVPFDPIPFLDMRQKVRQYHADDAGPILVHCGTGVARTGVFIAVDSLIEQYANEGQISVFSFVWRMREERPLMVRTLKQYVLIYECLFEEFQAGDTMIDAVSMKPKFHNWTQKNAKTGNTFMKDQYELLKRLTRELDAPSVVVTGSPRSETPSGLPSAAIFVDGYRQQNQFILTQTPQHNMAIMEFWRMVYERHVTTIAMLDNYKHEDSTRVEYWPHDVTMRQWGPLSVETTSAFQEENVTIRDLKMTDTQHPLAPAHRVRQFQFNGWDENTHTPVSKTMALDMLDLVLDFQQSTDHPNSPIVVHCEDGGTHSGLFVSLAILCERMCEEHQVDVYHAVKHVKRRRLRVIPDYDQYRFCYKALWDYINLRMPGGTFTDTLGQNKTDKTYGVASLSLASHQDSLY